MIPPGGTTLYLTISAPGYLNRKLQLVLTPAGEPQFYDVRLSALDGQALAVAGGFALTGTDVNLRDIFGFFGNLPLFSSRAIVVTKTVDKQAAEGGDRLAYQIAFSNASAYAFGLTSVVDTLPPGLAYLSGTARMDGQPFEPDSNGRVLTWSIAALNPGDTHTITYDAAIFGTVAPGTDLTNDVTVSGRIPGSTTSAGGSSSATVRVLDGPLSTRRIVTGRVFIDSAGTGHFERGDRGVAGVRIYLEDGTYVVTDPLGRFSFPSVRPGMHVLRIDPLTLPGNVRASENVPMNSTRALSRLLHGILDDATMEDVEFALEPQP